MEPFIVTCDRVTWGMTAPGGKTAPLPVDNLKLPRTFSEYTEWCYHLTDTCFERSTPRSQACAQMHLHLQVQMQMRHLHLHLHLIALRRMHLHLHLHLIHPHLHLHLHLIQMHLIGIKCETNANQMRNKFESSETVLLLHNVYFLSWFRLE